jgi:hypothetical protein
MTTVRKQFDADRIESVQVTQAFRSDDFSHEVFCDECSRALFVDDATYADHLAKLEKGYEQPFICNSCREIDDALAHS